MMNLSDVDVRYTTANDGVHLLCKVCQWETVIGFGESDLNNLLDTARSADHWNKHPEYADPIPPEVTE